MAQRTFSGESLYNYIYKANKEGKKIGLALGSGGARGIAHIGVLEVIKEFNIPIDYIAGTSIGAVVGALYAAGVKVEKMKKFALSLNKRQTMNLFDPILSFSGMFSGKKVVALLEDLGLRGLSFSNLMIPFSAIAADMHTGKEVVINKGSVVMAVRASSSIPLVFAPVIYKNYYLVDGGIIDPVPVKVVKKMGADIVIAVRLSGCLGEDDILEIEIEDNVEERKESLFDKLKRVEILREGKIDLRIPIEHRKNKPLRFTDIVIIASDIMEKIVEEKSLEKADIIISPYEDDSPEDIIKTFEFYRASEAIDKGKRSALNGLLREANLM